MDKSELTKDMRWYIADRIAEDRLPEINKHCKLVTPNNNFYVKYGKRAIDIVVSFFALLFTLPINIVIAIATFVDLGSPLFFRQSRLGKDAKLFEIVKFRNMRNTVDARGELLPPEQRVTEFGKIVRKTSLDELLNFWSIFKGDMTLIGPRPLVPEYKGRYNKRHYQRMCVKPGLECPPRNLGEHVWTWQEQLENDVWYVENVSFLTDCKMIINLFKFATDKKSIEARANAERGIFFGYDLDGIAINLDGVPQSYIDEAERVFAERNKGH